MDTAAAHRVLDSMDEYGLAYTGHADWADYLPADVADALAEGIQLDPLVHDSMIRREIGAEAYEIPSIRSTHEAAMRARIVARMSREEREAALSADTLVAIAAHDVQWGQI